MFHTARHTEAIRSAYSVCSAVARRLSAVGFKVYGYKSEPFDEFGDGDRYKVIEGGALEIWHEDGSKLTISPTRWGWVEEDVPEPEDTARARMSRSHPSRRMR
jgi:hypothetical protein